MVAKRKADRDRTVRARERRLSNEEHVGTRITIRRRALNMSMAELAERCGMKYDSLKRIEQGRVTIPRQWRELAKHLDVSPQYLIFGVAYRFEELEEQEKTLLLLFEKMLSEDKEKLMAFARFFAGEQKVPPPTPAVKVSAYDYHS